MIDWVQRAEKIKKRFKLRPHGPYITVVRLIDEDITETEGGMVLTDQRQQTNEFGQAKVLVLDVGPIAYSHDTWGGVEQVKSGDVVLVTRFLTHNYYLQARGESYSEDMEALLRVREPANKAAKREGPEEDNNIKLAVITPRDIVAIFESDHDNVKMISVGECR